MAITKIKSVRSTERLALAYICDPEKTEGQLLVSSFACTPETADIEFAFTRANAPVQRADALLSHHLVQAFKPGEVTPELAHQIGKQLADELLKGRFEYVLTTHTDKGHTHNHLIFNNVSFVDQQRFRSPKRRYFEIRQLSDRLCADHGLSVIEPSGEKGRSYDEIQAEKHGRSWKAKLKTTIDSCIEKAASYPEFLKLMSKAGYERKDGKYVSFRAPGQQRFTRAKTLGGDYNEERIRERIEAKNQPIQRRAARSRSRPSSQRIGLLIDIENNLKAQSSVGYSRWAQLHNLQMAAKTMAFLSEQGIDDYQQLEARLDQLMDEHQSIANALKSIEQRLQEMTLLLKQIDTYQRLQPIAEGYREAADKAEYERRHHGELLLYEHSKKALSALRGNSDEPLNLKALRADYDALLRDKDRLYGRYRETKKQLSQFDIMKRNVDQLLAEPRRAGRGREPER